MNQLSIGAIFKNEAPYLKEWIEYHLLVGVSHFFLYNNESSDDYRSILTPYIKEGVVTLKQWPKKRKETDWLAAQQRAYSHCIRKAKGRFHWLALIDLDEFLVPVKEKSLISFLSSLGRTIGAVHVNWQLYGTSGWNELPPKKLLIECLTQKAPSDYRRSEGPDHRRTKSIVRPEAVQSFAIHSGLYKKGFQAIPEDPSLIDIEDIRINHYWTRSERYFHEVKIKRRMEFSPLPKEVFFDIYNDCNQVEDPILLRYVPLLKEKIFSEKKLGIFKRILPPTLYQAGKYGWFSFLKIVQAICILKDIKRLKKKKKRIRYLFCIANPGTLGGTELQIQIIAEHFHECLIIVSGKVEEGRENLFLQELRAKEVPVLSLGQWGVACEKHSQWIKKAGAFLLHCVAPEAKICHFFNPVSTQLIPIVKKRGLKIYYMETGMPDTKGSWRSVADQIHHFDHVSSVSQAGLEKIKELFGYEGPSSIVPSIIRSMGGRKTGEKGRELHLLYVGRLTWLKRVDRLIESFAKLTKSEKNCQLTIVGAGALWDELNQQAACWGITNQVKFTGWITKEELSHYMSTADILCLPSESEGLPCSILEAMSFGIAILATRIGGILEVIEDGVNGILVDPEDENGFAQALLQLALNPCLRKKLGEQAFEDWKKRKNPLHLLQEAYETQS